MNDTFISKAFQFAARKHKGQERKDLNSSPYIDHPVSVAQVLAEFGGIDDPQILAAALLHDTLEDTNTTPEELRETFGKKVCRIVEEDEQSEPWNDKNRSH